jgi:hypothetical protein
MSQFEHLFLDPGHEEARSIAQQLMDSFGLLASERAGHLYLGTTEWSPSVGHVGGRIERNHYRILDPVVPADFLIYDGFPIVWSLWADVDTEEEQRRRARVVFDDVAAEFGWPSILVHDFEELVATYDPERGLREFPPGTPSDGTGRHIWG